jgi:hypothetical protein
MTRARFLLSGRIRKVPPQNRTLSVDRSLADQARIPAIHVSGWSGEEAHGELERAMNEQCCAGFGAWSV